MMINGSPRPFFSCGGGGTDDRVLVAVVVVGVIKRRS